jgi:hypothetical protein
MDLKQDLKCQPRQSNTCAVSIDGIMQVRPSIIPHPNKRCKTHSSVGIERRFFGSAKSRSMAQAKANVGLALSCLSSTTTAVADATVAVEEAKARMKQCSAKLEEAREKERHWAELLNKSKNNLICLEKEYEVINVDDEE